MRSRALVWVVLSFFVIPSVLGQTSVGHIEGTVVDSSGAPVPGATVTLESRSVPTRTTISDASGVFRFLGVPPGRYIVFAELTGFTRAQRKVEVTAGNTARLSLAMSVGAMTESVTVTADTDGPSPRHYRPQAAPPPVPPAMVPGVIAHPSPFEFNREGYARIDENPFRKVEQAPLSTFAIDVDTASYANVRRFLSTGLLPPPDAVRVEEMLNYFRYQYPPPEAGQPFSITTRVAECPWESRHQLVQVGLQARRLKSDAVPPRNLVFLVDVSGSMMPANKLPLVKSALALLVDQLGPRDRVALVVYAGNSGLVLPSTPGDRHDKILDALARLEAGGSTNGGQGIELAYKTAAESFVEGGVNRVILATDGDFNVGLSSIGDVTRLIEEKRRTGVFLSVLGVGEGNLQDATMEALADRGNGNYSYLDSLAEARKVLVSEANATLVTVAKDVKIQVEFNPRRVAAWRLVGYENRLLRDEDFKDDHKDAGEMGAGHSVTALYEVVPAGQTAEVTDVDPLRYQQSRRLSAAAASGELLTVKVRYKDPDGETSREEKSVLVAPGPALPRATGDLAFAAAVAEFGMLLRGSPQRGDASFPEVLSLARAGGAEEDGGPRADFVRLVEMAKGLARVARR